MKLAPIKSALLNPAPMMKSWTALAFALAATASATTLDFGVSYHGGGQSGGWGRVGVSDVPALGGRFSAGVSTRTAEVGYSRNLALPPLGVVTARTDAAWAWSGGGRVSARLGGSVGPVALNLGGNVFSASAAQIDPLAVWNSDATDSRERGLNADLSVRYRVSRTLIAVAGGEFGGQNMGTLGVEGRRELTRTLPLDEAAQPGDEPETEPVGTLTWRAGVRAGQNVLGVTGGVSYATESGLNLGIDALVGPKTFSVTGSADAGELLGPGSSVRLYAAYEPWRTASTPLRAGIAATRPVGGGEVGLNVSGGRTLDGKTGYGARLTYTLPLGESTQP
ncbi:hypothetical protein [Deinococcus arenicola]|uniref:Uncharacterized protein n=1 Tax=Deinococcus arenicola TaxID=2994950 RepID=A0ABU4DRZ8_9DEIO|nr:hypothetical protein [Deinococcus sp. ZS9-10]MDV6375207.1 hypothetical protein [Deinococcus sp. ZS9-10]